MTQQDWFQETKILPYVHLFPIVIFVEILGGKENSGECFCLQRGRGGGCNDGDEKEDCCLLSGHKKLTFLNASNSLIRRFRLGSHSPDP